MTVDLRRWPKDLLAERIYTKCRKEGNPGGCWIWVRATRLGYGKITIWTGGAQKTLLAHRVSYYLATGVDPGELLVCHHCDVRACINPEHLYVGTHADNMRDALDRDRFRKGEEVGWSKLTEDDVREIRSGQKLNQEYAQQYGISDSLITTIVRRKVWKHVAPDDREDPARAMIDRRVGEHRPNSKLTEAAVRTIRAGGRTAREFADLYGVEEHAIYRVVNRELWDHVPPDGSEGALVTPRPPHGEGHSNAKLDADKVRLIRSGQYTQGELVRMLGVSQTAISKVMLRKAWAHVQ